MVDQQPKAASEQTIKLTQLDKAIENSFKGNNRYSVVFDSTHNAEVFFRYKAHLIEVNKLSIGVTIGKISKEDALETIRKGLVYCMRSGDRLVLYLGNTAIDFKNNFTSDETNFPAEKIFNFAEWRKEENYKKIVR